MAVNFIFSVEWIPLLAALGGSVVAAAWDLKTTEVPDEVFYAMFGIGIGYYIYQSFLASSLMPFVMPAAFAGVMFLIGYGMYKFGQWGGADAFLLTAVAFLLPAIPLDLGFTPRMLFPFPVSYLINVFLVGTPYMLVYIAIIAARDRNVQKAFGRDMKASAKTYLIFTSVVFLIFLGLTFYISQELSAQTPLSVLVKLSAFPAIGSFVLFVIYKFGRSVENVAFKRKIPVSQLKVGDVLLESKQFVGISARKVAAIKKSGKEFVVIKEGVRFAPAFPLALLFTLFYGDAIFFILKYFLSI